MQLQLRRIVSPSTGYIFLYIFLWIILWGITYLGSFYTLSSGFDDKMFQHQDNEVVWRNLISISCGLIISILLAQLISRFSFVINRTFLPVFVFALLIAVWEPAHTMSDSFIALLLFAGALFQFLNMHQNEAAPEKSFLDSLFIGCGSLFVNDLVFLIPVCWLGFIALHSFSFRVFLASVIGAVVPWIIYGCVMYILLPEFNVPGLFHFNFSPGFSMEELQLPTQIYIGVLFILFLIILIRTYKDFYKHANATRRNLNFILILLICFIFVFILQEDFIGTFFPFIAFCFSVFISNIFSGKMTNFLSVVFIVFFVLNMVFATYNFLW